MTKRGNLFGSWMGKFLPKGMVNYRAARVARRMVDMLRS